MATVLGVILVVLAVWVWVDDMLYGTDP